MDGGDDKSAHRRIVTRSMTKRQCSAKAPVSSEGEKGLGIDLPKSRRVHAPIDMERQTLFSSKRCVGERLVDVHNLVKRVPGFEQLFEEGELYKICSFQESTGYGSELVKEFYMRAGHLITKSGGPYAFSTTVRGIEIRITPEVIASVLDMPVYLGGVDFLHAGFDSSRDWHLMIEALCVSNPANFGTAIMATDLKTEYRHLYSILCYNLMPLTDTTLVRWEQLLYMFLLSCPDIVEERDINLNVPFLLWKRMAREIRSAHLTDCLPFPLLVMRLLRSHDVNVMSTSLEYSLGHITVLSD